MTPPTDEARAPRIVWRGPDLGYGRPWILHVHQWRVQRWKARDREHVAYGPLVISFGSAR